MTNAFVTATQNAQKVGRTYNNAVTHATSDNPVLDFFNAAGTRAADLSSVFELARSHDSKLAYRVALWTRDVRGGAGERETFRNILRHLDSHSDLEDDLIKLIPKIPEIGRWDDLLILRNPRAVDASVALISKALEAGNGLCAKWMPRKGPEALALRTALGLTPKQYRKKLVSLTNVVETPMCAGAWDAINFDHVPSVAAARYQKAFYKHAPDAYKAYRDGLHTLKEDGTTERKINASAVYPYDVLKSVEKGDRKVAEAQWNSLPDFLGDNQILPVVDVSGSMFSFSYYGQRKPVKSNVAPIDISVSLGLYCADKQKGAFNGMFMTFSSNPRLQHLTGSILDKVNQLKNADWGMSTNISAAFRQILSTATANRVPQEDMPKMLLIISDMEFDRCSSDATLTAFEDARLQFERAGYELPKVVFWNVNGRADNAPVQQHTTGTALVSGFSPAILKSVLSDRLENFTPEAVMLETIMSPRYDVEGLTV